MSTAEKSIFLSQQAYLEGEKTSEVKHEFVNGQIFSMAGASENHNLIAGTIARKFGNHLELSPCKTFVSDMMLHANQNNFYPDVMVVCDEHQNDTTTLKHAPSVIVEVLSETTRKRDRTVKLMSYINLPSLQEYVLVEQDKCEIEVLRRSKGWIPQFFYLGDEVTFDSIGLTLTVEDIYHRVDNANMAAFLEG